MALKSSLISYWKCDEASGNLLDAHGSNELTDTNTVTSDTGKINDARQFTAANSEYFTIADNASISTGDIDFTFAAWVYLDSKAANRRIIAKTDNGSNTEYQLTYRQSVDRFDFYIANGTIGVEANNLGSPSTATWYFIVAWHDSVANTMNIQVNNGTADSGATGGTGPTDTAQDLQVGRLASEYMDGRIDEIAFWKRTLSDSERTQLYNGGSGLSYDVWDRSTGNPLMFSGGLAIG